MVTSQGQRGAERRGRKKNQVTSRVICREQRGQPQGLDYDVQPLCPHVDSQGKDDQTHDARFIGNSIKPVFPRLAVTVVMHLMFKTMDTRPFMALKKRVCSDGVNSKAIPTHVWLLLITMLSLSAHILFCFFFSFLLCCFSHTFNPSLPLSVCVCPLPWSLITYDNVQSFFKETNDYPLIYSSYVLNHGSIIIFFNLITLQLGTLEYSLWRLMFFVQT